FFILQQNKRSDFMTKRRVFYSFHYEKDVMRASQIRNIGVIEGNTPVSDNDWETVKRGGDIAIKRWIDDNMSGCSCLVVLIGENTAERKWVRYEIERAWQ
ncbi:MAG: TIR domain-containing protein, partial [Endomicrobium sp.]|nr:TIR domain-containing protein [Endomicrobium sp.]